MIIPRHMGRPEGSSSGAVGRAASSGWMIAGANPAGFVGDVAAAAAAA